MKTVLGLIGTTTACILDAICALSIFLLPIALTGLYVLATEFFGVSWSTAYIVCVITWAAISLSIWGKEGSW